MFQEETKGNCEKVNIALPLFVWIAHNGRVHSQALVYFV